MVALLDALHHVDAVLTPPKLPPMGNWGGWGKEAMSRLPSNQCKVTHISASSRRFAPFPAFPASSALLSQGPAQEESDEQHHQEFQHFETSR